MLNGLQIHFSILKYCSNLYAFVGLDEFFKNQMKSILNAERIRILSRSV